MSDLLNHPDRSSGCRCGACIRRRPDWFEGAVVDLVAEHRASYTTGTPWDVPRPESPPRPSMTVRQYPNTTRSA